MHLDIYIMLMFIVISMYLEKPKRHIERVQSYIINSPKPSKLKRHIEGVQSYIINGPKPAKPSQCLYAYSYIIEVIFRYIYSIAWSWIL
jgi:hypothetical protein